MNSGNSSKPTSSDSIGSTPAVRPRQASGNNVGSSLATRVSGASAMHTTPHTPEITITPAQALSAEQVKAVRTRTAALLGLGTTHDGADDKKHDINQVMFTIDIRAGFFDKGKVFNQGHRARFLHGYVIRSQTISLFKFH